MTSRASPSALSVAEAKRRFSELIERVGRGERLVICRRGKPVMTLSSVEAGGASGRAAPTGLASLAGALSGDDDLDEMVAEIYAARRRSTDRTVEPLGE